MTSIILLFCAEVSAAVFENESVFSFSPFPFFPCVLQLGGASPRAGSSPKERLWSGAAAADTSPAQPSAGLRALPCSLPPPSAPGGRAGQSFPSSSSSGGAGKFLAPSGGAGGSGREERGERRGRGSAMAKWGQGDPRWIVEERADGTNVNNWHW